VSRPADEASAALAAIPDAFWTEVRARVPRVLMLDYDGTLAPFHEDRGAARPLPGSLRALRRLTRSAGTRVAIVSGRPIHELADLLDLPVVPLIGEHGWEETGPGGIVRHPLGAATAEALARAADAIAHLAGPHLERKRTAIVLHTRGLPPREAQALTEAGRAAWRPETEAGPLRLHGIHHGLELRADGHDKGSAVRALLDRAGDGAFGVFVGDDTTDEDAFQALERRGVGIRVGDAAARTRAQAWLPDCAAVAAFLERWLDRVEPWAAQAPA
jgi:trehalose-phosphatase